MNTGIKRSSSLKKYKRIKNLKQIKITMEIRDPFRCIVKDLRGKIDRKNFKIKLKSVRVTVISDQRDSRHVREPLFRVTSKGIKAETANKTRDGRKSSIRRPLESIGIIRLAPQRTGTEERPGTIPRGRRDGSTLGSARLVVRY